MLLRSCKRCFFFLLLPAILCFLSLFFFVSFLDARSVHGRLQLLTPSLKATSNGGHRCSSRSCHDLRHGLIWTLGPHCH
ncbi:hypothetical protein EUGRSUZ_C01337 [Eucalyptus grandis]|uniref:Uncharacterized protein n=2 Tax=Eucalyptus grandis TaxID=71139 RepID=A0A059CNI5_EUCGR|nr:hypothetical protein EUGRSUZ_C01337 [Eucalyptus grandis]